MFQYLAYGPTKFYGFGRDAANNTVRENVFTYNSTGSNNTPAPYMNSGQQRNIAAYPYILVNYYIRIVSLRLIILFYIYHPCTYHLGMVARVYREVLCYSTIPFDDNLSICRRQMQVCANPYTVIDVNIRWVPDI